MSDLNLRALLNDSNLAPTLRPALPKLIFGTCAAVASGLAILAALWCMVYLIGSFSIKWLIFAVVFWLVAAALAAFASWLVHDAEAGFSARLRRKIANHLMHLPSSTISKQGDHGLKRLASDDVATLHHMIAHLPSEVAIFTVIPLVSIIVLIAMFGVSALWILLPGFIASLYYLIVVPYISKRDGAARMQVMLDIIAKADDYVRGIRVNRIYGQQSGVLASYTKATEQFSHNMVSWVAKVATLAAIAVALLQAVATFAIAYLMAYQYDTMTLAVSLFFSLAIVTPALRLGHGLDYVAAGRAAAGHISEFLKLETLPSGQVQRLDHATTLKIVDASFSIDDRSIFHQLNFTFPDHAITAITGPSGVGKTTLLKMIAGLEVLKQGNILLAPIDVSQLDEQLRHENILFIPQGVDVLEASVRDNLLLSAPNTTDLALEQALVKAQLKVDLDVDACLLSGGEKQRLALARAFLTEASIILLDEPTSALDAVNAAKLMQELRGLAEQRNKTIVFVTHDLVLAESADARLVLDHVESY